MYCKTQACVCGLQFGMFRYNATCYLLAVKNKNTIFLIDNVLELNYKKSTIMQIENETTIQNNDVLLAAAKFLSALWLEGDFRNQPVYLAEIFDNILETEIGNDLDLRTKMIGCIKTSKMLVKALEPFSDQQIENACIEIINTQESKKVNR